MCKEIRKYINEYIDGVASDDVKAKVESHLSDCKECKQLYEELLSLTSMIKAIPQAEVPDGLESKALDEISKLRMEQVQEPIVSNPRKKLYKRLASLAAIFVVGIFAITMYNNNDMIDSMIYKDSQYPSQDLQEISKQRSNEDLASVADEYQNNVASESESEPVYTQSTATKKVDTESTYYAKDEIASDPEEEYFTVSDRKSMEQVEDRADSSQPCRGMHKVAEKPFYATTGANDAEQVLLYMRCLEEELEGSEFQIKSSKKIDYDVWRFEVIINGEPIYYLGQGGEIWKETTEKSSL